MKQGEFLRSLKKESAYVYKNPDNIPDCIYDQLVSGVMHYIAKSYQGYKSAIEKGGLTEYLAYCAEELLFFTTYQYKEYYKKVARVDRKKVNEITLKVFKSIRSEEAEKLDLINLMVATAISKCMTEIEGLITFEEEKK